MDNKEKDLAMEVANRLFNIFNDILWIKNNGLNALDVPSELFFKNLDVNIALCAARTISKLKEEKE